MENRIIKNTAYTSLSEKGKKFGRIYLTATIIFFIISSFSFFEMLYEVCNVIGSVVSGSLDQAVYELKRTLPIILTFASLFYLSSVNQSIFTASERKKRLRSIIINTNLIALIALISFVYIIVGLADGQYHSLLECYPTPAFPFDILVIDSIIIILTVVCFFKRNYIADAMEEAIGYQENNKNTFISGLDHLFYGFAYFLSAYAFGTLLYAPTLVDFVHGHTFFIIMFLLMLTLPVIMLFLYLLFKGKEKDKKTSFQFKSSLIMLVVSVAFVILYIVAANGDPEAINDTVYGLLPVEYTASVNGFTFVFCIPVILMALTAFIKSLTGMIKNKKQNN